MHRFCEVGNMRLTAFAIATLILASAAASYSYGSEAPLLRCEIAGQLIKEIRSGVTNKPWAFADFERQEMYSRPLALSDRRVWMKHGLPQRDLVTRFMKTPEANLTAVCPSIRELVKSLGGKFIEPGDPGPGPGPEPQDLHWPPIYSVSLPVVSDDGEDVLVSEDVSCGNSCGAEFIRRMHLGRDGRWRIVDSRQWGGY
jgi:hypothetical protein